MKISIITVCYNSAATIEQTIQSVINQTYKNIEYIIIDGGSTDGTVDIIRRYEADIAYWVSEADQGLYDAMNKGIKAATGEIVGIINSDDWYDRYAVERVSACFEKEKVDIVHGRMTLVWWDEHLSYVQQNSNVEKDLFFRMTYNHPTVFIKRSLYEQYGGFDLEYKIAADYDLMLRLYNHGCSSRSVPYILAYFRMGGCSNSRVWRCALETQKVAVKHLIENKDADKILKEKQKLYYEQKRALLLRKYLLKRAERSLKKERIRDILSIWWNIKKKVMIFGAGIDGIECLCWLRKQGFLVECFLDNSEEKQKMKLGGMMIHAPSYASEFKGDIIVLLPSNIYEKEKEAQLISMEMKRFTDYICSADIQREIIRCVYGDRLLKELT